MVFQAKTKAKHFLLNWAPEGGVAEPDVGEGVTPLQRAVRGRYHVSFVYERSGAAVNLGCYSELW